ncbi:MAG: hypothetical protein JNK09_02575 [Prolixibacteraceae bacterium]|nr:hypothetical protein [Prolixibacteraceae bacterium]
MTLKTKSLQDGLKAVSTRQAHLTDRQAFFIDGAGSSNQKWINPSPHIEVKKLLIKQLSNNIPINPKVYVEQIGLSV